VAERVIRIQVDDASKRRLAFSDARRCSSERQRKLIVRFGEVGTERRSFPKVDDRG